MTEFQVPCQLQVQKEKLKTGWQNGCLFEANVTGMLRAIKENRSWRYWKALTLDNMLLMMYSLPCRMF